MALIDRLRAGDELHREAAAALDHFGLFSEFVLSDTERGLAFVKWQRATASELRQLEPILRKGKAARDHDARAQSSPEGTAPGDGT